MAHLAPTFQPVGPIGDECNVVDGVGPRDCDERHSCVVDFRPTLCKLACLPLSSTRAVPMPDLFTPEEIERLSGEVNDQLRRLATEEPALQRGKGAARPRAASQRKAIEQATGQDATTFLARFRQAARRDLCEKGGVLNKQWTKYRDLPSKSMLNTFGGILVGLGISGGALHIAVVAVAAYVLYLGVQAFCAGEE
jgi:hypothetical protein